MQADERVRDLCSQLLRAENPAIVKVVAAEMKAAIDEYVDSKDDEEATLSES